MSLGLTLPQFITKLMRELSMARYPTPVQLQILDYIQGAPSMAQVDMIRPKDPGELWLPGKVSNRKIVCGFRGVGKSFLTAGTGLWWLDEDPDEKLLFVSASGGFAKKITTWMLTTIKTVPWLAHLRPDTRDGRYSNIEFDVGCCLNIEQSPSVRAAGIYGQVTGSRASKVIVDDCETPQTCLTQLQRERLKAGLEECESILKPIPTAAVYYLGTPHASAESVYFFLNKQRGYDMRMWPARVPEKREPYKGMLAPNIDRLVDDNAGKPTDTRFSEETLREKQLSMSPAKWRLQFMLDPTLTDAEKFPLKCADLIVATLDDTLPEVVMLEKHHNFALPDLPCAGMGNDTTFYRPSLIEGTVRAADVPTVLILDPSGGGADQFAWGVLSAWGGNFYLRALGGQRGATSDAMWERLAQLGKKHSVKRVLVESNFGGLAVWEQVGKPFFQAAGHPVTFEGIRTGGMRKELRIIDTLAPVVQTHRLIVDRRIIEEDAEIFNDAEDDAAASYSFIYQFTRITEVKGSIRHDDKLDTVALGVQFFQEQAAQDQQVQHEKRRHEYALAALEDSQGYSLLNANRMALGMTLEQARLAAASDTTGSNWLDR